MKTLFLTLGAVLGIAIGVGAVVPAASASTVQLFPPADTSG